MHQVVYVDVVFLENFFMNYLLLYFVKRFCNFKSKWWRVSLGAALGSFYVFAVFFKDVNFTCSAILKFLVSVLMILAAFPIKTKKSLVKTIILFYIAAFITSGSIFALFYFLNTNFETVNGSFVIKDIKTWHIIIGSIAANLLIKLAFDFFDNYHKVRKEKINLGIKFMNKYVKIKALIDTGNSLREPLSNKPVIVVNREAVDCILPDDLKEFALHNKGLELYKSSLTIDSCNRIRLIPYKALGIDNGVLLGLCVDSIEVNSGELNVIINNGIIALYDRPISENNDYDALAYPEILNGGI